MCIGPRFVIPKTSSRNQREHDRSMSSVELSLTVFFLFFMVSFHCFCFTWFSSVALVSRVSSVSPGFSWFLSFLVFLFGTVGMKVSLEDLHGSFGVLVQPRRISGHILKHTTQRSNWREKGNKDPSPRAAAPWQTSLTLKGFDVFEKFKMSGFLMQSLPIFFTCTWL